jgi:hypothetical protein
MGQMRNMYNILVSLMGRDHLRDLGIDGREESYGVLRYSICLEGLE